MLNKSKTIALFCGGVSIAVTILFYLVTFENIFTVPMRWLSLSFLLLSEVIGTIKAFTAKRTVFGISNTVTSVVHLLLVFILSIIFVNIFPLLIKKYILLNVLILCILLAVDVVILYFENCIASQNVKLSECQSVMEVCVEKAVALCLEYNHTDYKKDLEEIVELLKYSDSSFQSQDERIIMSQLDALQQLLKDNSDEISKKIIEMKNIIKLRSIKVANAKRGSY